MLIVEIAICPSLRAIEERRRAVKNDGTTGAIRGRISANIAFDKPSRPKAFSFEFSKDDVVSCAEKIKSEDNGYFHNYFGEPKFVLHGDNRDKNLYHFEAILLVQSENKFPLACGQALR